MNLNINEVVYPQLSGELFERVQMERIFDTSKLFVDCVSRLPFEEVTEKYFKEKNDPGFDLKTFVLTYFELPPPVLATSQPHHYTSLNAYLENTWDELIRDPDQPNERGTRIPLPRPYVVPGGVYREIYYWDSFFSALGLCASQRLDLVRDMCDNFSFLIETLGFVPNGNRIYYATRSQPPVFPLLVSLLNSHEPNVYTRYVSTVEKEYLYWTDGIDTLSKPGDAVKHVVKLSGDLVLNRYFDTKQIPREESFYADITNAAMLPQEQRPEYFQHVRAASESGWDFSSRWLEDYKTMKTIRTMDILPVDLNCLLYYMETKLSEWFLVMGNHNKSGLFASYAYRRKQTIQKYFWNSDKKFYFDYDFRHECATDCWSLAGVFPLYFGIATQQQAESVAEHLRTKFLTSGGLIATLFHTTHLWDAPYSWAPLNWIAIRGLEIYGYTALAKDITTKILALYDHTFRETGNMYETYNTEGAQRIKRKEGNNVQVGFGWTNGVALDLLRTK